MTLRQDILIRQGETWSHVYTHRDSAGDAVDLTGYSARMSIKESYEGATEAYLSSGADADGGSIALGGAAGTVTLSMTAAQTSALLNLLFYTVLEGPARRAARNVDFLYDVEIVSGAGAVTRVIEGRLRVQREVTG